jgi:hypothetical protein
LWLRRSFIGTRYDPYREEALAYGYYFPVVHQRCQSCWVGSMLPVEKTHHVLVGVLSEASERDPLVDAVVNTAAHGALS